MPAGKLKRISKEILRKFEIQMDILFHSLTITNIVELNNSMKV